jgi:hypothetical protein
MLNNIIGVLEENDRGIAEICVAVSNVVGVKIEAENVEDLVSLGAKQFVTDEQKANLQKRMVCAAQIYRRFVGEVYKESASSGDLKKIVKGKSKSDAFLSWVLDVLGQDLEYQTLANSMLRINNCVLDSILGNNFSLNPDLKLCIDQAQLKDCIFGRDKIISELGVQSLFGEAVKEAFDMIDVMYLSIGDESITLTHAENAVALIKGLDSVVNLLDQNTQHNFDEGDENPLHTLFDEEDDIKMEIVKDLLDRGFDPNQINEAGESPFHVACSMSVAPEIIQLLIERGANLELHNGDGQTGLDILIELLPSEDVQSRLDSYELINFILADYNGADKSVYVEKINSLFASDIDCNKATKRKLDGSSIEQSSAKRVQDQKAAVKGS